jgi:hypothetical protein
MNDITVVYYTANFANDHFVNATRQRLIESIGDIPVVSVSQKPMDFGINICVGDVGRSQINIYKQVSVGIKVATTKYVALCEDDCLYPPSHFTCFRPKDDEFGYNMNRWGLYTWTKPPIFSNKNRVVLSQCIANREFMIECINERFARYPDESTIPLHHFAEFGKYEKWMEITIRKRFEFRSPEPTIMFSHPDAIGYAGLGTKKKHGDVRRSELEYWGTADEVLKKYWGNERLV